MLRHDNICLFFPLFSSTFPPLCQRDSDVEGEGRAGDGRIDSTSCQPSGARSVFLKTSKSDRRGCAAQAMRAQN